MGQLYALTNDEGLVVGFFDDAINPSIPPAAVPISAEVYREWLANQRTQRWDGTALVPYTPPVTLADVKATAKRAADAEFAARVAAGMPWAGTALQIDTDSRANLLGAKGLADAGALPTPFGWRMLDNSMLPLDAAGVQAMATAVGLYYAALFARKSALVDAIAAAEDVAAVAAISVTAVWP